MTTAGPETETDALLAHAERQTKALENIQGAMMLLLALAIVGAVLGAAAFFG